MRRSTDLVVPLLAVMLGGLAGACGGGGDGTTSGGGGAGAASTGGTTTTAGSGGSGGSGGGLFGGSGGALPDAFPSDPVVEPSAPPDAPALFGSPGSGDPTGGPCLFEPEPGALFPRNWLRPRFRYQPGAGQNLFEIRLHTAAEKNDLVVYTANLDWTMPKPMWQALAAKAQGVPITMTVRGATYDGAGLTSGPSAGTTGDITIAPADAPGAIVYWTTSGGSALKGFQVGDETVGLALAPDQVQMPTVGGAAVTCVGCHTSTPDGKFASFTAQGPWSNALASIEMAAVGEAPPYLGAGALQTFAQLSDLGIHSYSKAHYQPGDHVMVTPFGSYLSAQLIWIDLEAAAFGEGTSYGVLAREGDPRGAGAPTWSHDGDTVVYVSTDAEFTGRLDNGFADLYAIPYNDRQGGPAAAIPGASDPALEEYYPAFSPDDALLAFNRIPNGNNMYNQPLGEVFVLPSKGGSAVRLAANDPVACSNKQSPGVTNSWPKWAPAFTAAPDGKTYYFLIFSSTRGDGGNPQLYITGIARSGDQIETYSSIYLWNQPPQENNHTPAWDYFKIPDEPPQ
jgi:hypothetical protein